MKPSRRYSIDQTRARIERMEDERQARRRAYQERKLERAEEEQRNLALGNPGDVDFIGLVRAWRQENVPTGPVQTMVSGTSTEQPKICICVRKRPISEKEKSKLDHDSITCISNSVWIHAAKLRVDGITKYLDHSNFNFDHAFGENSSTEDIYQNTVMPLVDYVLTTSGGRATVFAYGQTGSGKTYTMGGIQRMVVEDLFMLMEGADDYGKNEDDFILRSSKTYVSVSFFELYGGKVVDLLNEKRKLQIYEDGKGEVVVSGLEEFEAQDADQLFQLMERGNALRTTHATDANDTSSRSHSVCQINLRSKNNSKLMGKLSLVDLAGSERGVDTKSNNRLRRAESAEINKSLLALKECIRALDTTTRNQNNGAAHVPYRGSKLTMVLKDCFTSKLAKTTMIATVSPGASSADHSINTLRYADRIKEKKTRSTSPKPAPVSKSNGRSQSPLSSSYNNRENMNGQLLKSEKLRQPQTRIDNHTNSKKTLTQLSPKVKVAKQSRIPTLSPTSSPPPPPPRQCYREDSHKRAVEAIHDEEEKLLNLHMTILRNDAKMIQAEVKLLNEVDDDQGDASVDMTLYIEQLDTIIERREKSVNDLKTQLNSFRDCLARKREFCKERFSSPSK